MTQNEIFALVNFAFLSSGDNKILGGVAPSVYKGKMKSSDLNAILNHGYVPESLFTDDFDKFKEDRLLLLKEAAGSLIA
jgi:hypothetical protein